MRFSILHSLYFRKYSTFIKTLSQEADSLKQKIIYNCCLIENDETALTYSQRKRKKQEDQRQQFDQYASNHASPKVSSISVKYLTNNTCAETSEKITTEDENSLPPISFPFSRKINVIKREIKNDEELSDFGEWLDSSEKFVKKAIAEKNWIPFDANLKQDSVESEKDSITKYGTVDPNFPVSNVSCGGCGALLHCKDTSIPGFVPKELFEGLNEKELRTLICQRCHFLKEYDIALRVNVTPDEYPKILSHIKAKKALVILMVDLTDFPCSIWPGLPEIIGNKRPIVVVGNKVDLIMQDSPKAHENIRESLLSNLESYGFLRQYIKHVGLISAKTGYGIEELITTIHSNWRYQGDVYIVGCTNVGKSSLFNALIQSDYCKVQAVDLMQKATVSEWPGTTLNLLRFPILRPSTWRLQIRKERMQTFLKRDLERATLREELMKKSKFRKQITLAGPVGRSFFPENPMQQSDPFSVAISSSPSGVSPLGVDPTRKEFRESKWCYDTPGVVQPDQLLHLLTTSEIMQVLPKKLLIPRIFHLRPGFTIFIAGLSRLDFVDGPDFVWFSVFASEQLPLTVVKTEHADEVYSQLLGTELMQVPMGNPNRLNKWPKMKSKKLQVIGKHSGEVDADVVLSSSGWIGVTLNPAEFCDLQLWTPEGRGIYLRCPPLVRFAHRFRGMRIPGRPAFKSSIDIVS